MTELLLVGAGALGMGWGYITAARKLGVRVRLVETAAVAEKLRDMVDDVHLSRGTTDEQWAEAAYAAAARSTPDGVVAFAEPHVTAAALVQDRYGLPGPGLHAATLSRNKGLQRARFAAHGLPQPEFHVTDSLAAAAEWATPRLPVVIKPLSENGSFGVELIPDADAFAEAAQRRTGRLLVESVATGPEYSWEGLVSDGVVLFGNVTAKDTTGPPRFVELAHRPGHLFGGEREDAVDTLARGVVAALGMRTGLVHLEFRMSPAGPVIMEVAVRTPGDFIMDVVSLTYGFDLFDAVLRLALGRAPELSVRPSATSYAASWFPIAQPGRIVSVGGMERISAHPGVVRAQLHYQAGEELPPLRSSVQRLGHVLVNAATADERDAALSFVQEHLDVVVTPA